MEADVAPTIPPRTPLSVPAALGSVPEDDSFCHGQSHCAEGHSCYQDILAPSVQDQEARRGVT